MDTRTHTPGPWEVGEHDPDQSISIEYEGAQIGQVYNSEDFPCLSEDDEIARCQAEAEANAHLIAAAPDLLDALKRNRDASAAMMRWIADNLSTDNMLRFAGMMEREGYAGFDVMAQYAIAKAEGR
jgi:hypothetical protein